MMGTNKFAMLAAAGAATMAVQAFAVTNALVLNEANCVSGSKYLEVSGTGSSRKIGTDTGMLNVRVQGNGNNILELLVVGETDAINHTMDLRNYHLNWRFDKGDGNSGSGTITFKSVTAFSAVKKGTLITISEFQKISYDPSVDSADTTGGLSNGGHLRWAGLDGYGINHAYVSGKTTANGTLIDLSTGAQNSTYHKHFWAGDTSAESTLGASTEEDGFGNPYAESDYFTFTGSVTSPSGTVDIGDPLDLSAGLFVTNNDNWGLEVRDGSNNVVTNWVGEAETGYTAGGVSSGEMLKLQQVSTDTSGHATYDYAGNYGNGLMADGKESTIGVENKWSAGTKLQDLTSVR